MSMSEPSESGDSDSPPKPVPTILVPVDDDDQDYRRYVVEWAKFVKRSGDKCSPPVTIVLYPDLLAQEWGWDRLVPFSSGVVVVWSIYMKYLQDYYNHNCLEYVSAAEQNPEEWPLKSAERIPTGGNGRGNANGLAAVAQFCLKMEEQLMSKLKKQKKRVTRHTPVILHSRLIQQQACLMIRAQFSAPAAAALLCIAKEADLMCELLRHPAKGTGRAIKTSDSIRVCALSLMNCKGCESFAAAAAMVGISKEAKMMCEWMRKENALIDDDDLYVPHEITELYDIRAKMLRIMDRILQDSLSSIAALGDTSEKFRKSMEKRKRKKRKKNELDNHQEEWEEELLRKDEEVCAK